VNRLHRDIRLQLRLGEVALEHDREVVPQRLHLSDREQIGRRRRGERGQHLPRLSRDETNRRRAKQIAYNEERGIDPQPLRKKIADITDLITKEAEDTEELSASAKKRSSVISAGLEAQISSAHSLPRQELIALIESLTEQMKAAAAELAFELAGRLRDEIRDLKKELRGMEEAGT